MYPSVNTADFIVLLFHCARGYCLGGVRGRLEVVSAPLIVAVVLLREQGYSFLHMLGSLTCRFV